MLRRIVAMSQGVAGNADNALPPVETLDGFGRLGRAAAAAETLPPARLRRRRLAAPSAGLLRHRGCAPRLEPRARGEELRASARCPATSRRESYRAAARSISGLGCWPPPCAGAHRPRRRLSPCAGSCRASGRRSAVMLVAIAGPAHAQRGDEPMRAGRERVPSRLYPHRHPRCRRGSARRARRPRRHAQPPHRGRGGRADGGRYRQRRAGVLPAALLAGGRRARRCPRRRRSSASTAISPPAARSCSTRATRARARRSRPEAQAMLRQLARGLDIPPLVPVPPDHVLTKSFYLMQEFPGRWAGGKLWVEPAEDGSMTASRASSSAATTGPAPGRSTATACRSIRSCRAASRSARWPIASASIS